MSSLYRNDLGRTNLVRAEHVLVEDLHSDPVDKRVGNPSTVVAVRDLTKLIRADLVHGDLVRSRVVLDGDLGGHATHSSNSPPVDGSVWKLDTERGIVPMAGLDEQTDI